ncbi:hypothetical protein GCM10027398_35800 [Azotobacter salinestris]
MFPYKIRPAGNRSTHARPLHRPLAAHAAIALPLPRPSPAKRPRVGFHTSLRIAVVTGAMALPMITLEKKHGLL